MKKRISFTAIMAFSVMIAMAQPGKGRSGGTSFGLRGGVNFQTINGKDASDNKLSNDILTGFNIGLNAEIPVAPAFYIQPGLLFTTKGAKNEDIILGQTIKSTLKISYLELPLNFLYKPPLGKGRLLLGFGPYVALGVGGKATYDGAVLNTTEDIVFKNKVTLADTDTKTYIRPLDAGANLLAGYEFSNRFSFQLNAQLGLTKINPDYDGVSNDKNEARNTGFGVSLGVRF